jgi:preprotein translocase subunit YajC
MELAEWQYRKYCTSETTRVILFFFFVWFFWYFSQHKKQQNRSYTKFHLKQKSDVVYRKSGSSLKSVRELWWIFFFIFLNFFDNFVEPQTDRSCVWPASEWCQQAPVKISDFLDTRAKSYARFTEGTSSYVLKTTRMKQPYPFSLIFFFFYFFWVTEGEKQGSGRWVGLFFFSVFFVTEGEKQGNGRWLGLFFLFFLRNRRRKTRKRCWLGLWRDQMGDGGGARVWMMEEHNATSNKWRESTQIQQCRLLKESARLKRVLG